MLTRHLLACLALTMRCQKNWSIKHSSAFGHHIYSCWSNASFGFQENQVLYGWAYYFCLPDNCGICDYFWFVHLFRIVLGFISGVITLSILVVYDCNFWNPNELSWLQYIYINIFGCVMLCFLHLWNYDLHLGHWTVYLIWFTSCPACMQIHLELKVYGSSCMTKTREERKNKMVVEQPMIGSSFNNSSIQMNGGTDHVKSDFTLNRGSPFGSTYKEASL